MPRSTQGRFRPRVERLFVGSRDGTKLIEGAFKQVGVARGLLEAEVPVHGILCFVEADWPLLGGNFTTHGVDVLWPKKLYRRLHSEGPLLPGHLPRSWRADRNVEP